MADRSVLLGLVDGNMSENDDRICGWSTNKIGGTPNWLLGPPMHYPTCPLCNRLLYLACQIYCPLSDSVFHRVLYIFGCVNTSCWNKNKSWKVLRCQAKDSSFVSKTAKQNECPTGFEVDDWCDDAEDWGDESDDVITGLEQCTGNLKLSKNHMEKDLETVTELNTTQPPKESSVNSGLHFQPLYVSVIEVPDGRDGATELTKHEKKLLSEYQQREGVQVMDLMDPEGVKGWGGERYESAAVKHGDKAFHKFNKTLQVCPQQCLRYQWSGTPVSMVTTNQSELLANVPPCQHCGAGRVFEVQLMPALVGKLKCAKQSNANWDEIQLSQGNHGLNIQTSENGDLKLSGEILRENPVLQEEQRKTFLAAVNQMSDVSIEFGTVMVFTCSQSCWKDSENVGNAIYLEEICLVEADADEKLFQ